MSHTPGPWSLAPAAFTPLQLRMVCGRAFDGSEKSIVDRVRGRSPDEADANARLIAAAPTLLKAVKLALMEFDRIAYQKRADSDVLDMLTKAVAKAEPTS